MVDTTKDKIRDPYASQRGGPSNLAKLWAKYKPAVVGYVNDLNQNAGEHLAQLRASTKERGYGPATQKTLEDLAAGYDPALMGVVKAAGGNWLSGAVEQGTKRLKANLPPSIPLAEVNKQEVLRNTELNNWIDKQLSRYIKNDMATPGDPIRALAERGVLHVDPGQLNFRPEMHGKYLEPGQTAVAQHPTAKVWEGASDLKVYNNKAGDYLGGDDWVPGSINASVDLNPWLVKVPPETPVHTLSEPSSLPNDLGFDHLMDELRNAINPGSGLPRELLLKYSSLPQLSVPQAVERVAKINAWRAAKIAEANAAKANNAATVLHKDYPGKGFKWVELKGRNPDEFEQSISGLEPKDWDEAIKKFRTERERELTDALKYEGDTMGHCVGGYCPDVLEGRSRIFSLRSAKGEPHVTVEVQPQKRWNTDTIPNTEEDVGQRIVQIKGKANKAPNPEYLPFVQDFVRSGKWSDVDDLQNTGLRRSGNAWNVNEEKMIRAAGKDIPPYLTQSEIDDINAQVWPKPEGFSAGGLVGYDPDRINQRVAELTLELGL